MSDLAANKSFFMSFVRHPSVVSIDGIRSLLIDLKDVKESKEYAEMFAVSKKKTDEVKDLKRQRNQARLAVKRGRRSDESQALIDSWVWFKETEAASRYGYRKQKGVAYFLGPRMGE